MQKLYAPNDAIAEGLRLLPAAMNTRKARVLMYAIALQESRFTHRRQIGGPARGFWQFERGGGVRGVMTHPSSARYARSACEIVGVPFEAAAIHQAMARERAAFVRNVKAATAEIGTRAR